MRKKINNNGKHTKAGVEKLTDFVDNGVFKLGRSILDEETSNGVRLVNYERELIESAVKEIPIAMDRLRLSLSDDADFDAVYRLVKGAYYIGGTILTPWLDANADRINGKKGTELSVKTRKEKADKEYRDEALILANDYIAKNPGPLNIERTAKYIEDHIKSEHVKSLDTYKRAVREFRNKKLLVGLPD